MPAGGATSRAGAGSVAGFLSGATRVSYGTRSPGTMRGLRRISACATLALALFAGAAQPEPQAIAKTPQAKDTAEWVELDRVVDGDTIRVHRHGKSESLRLVSVDTEERLGPNHPATATKPQTVFGEETALWAEKLF